MRSWLRSDLIGIPVTLAAFGLFLLAAGVFCLAGPLAGIVFSVPAWIAIFYLIKIRPSDLAAIEKAPEGPHHRVLVVADEGLDHVDLVEEVSRRRKAATAEVMVIAPVVASSRAHAIADEIDVEERDAQQRVDRVLQALAERGIPCRGHVDNEGDPMQAMLDGLREFPANEVVIVPGAERGWEQAESLAERVQREVGLPVTEVGGVRRS